MLAFHRSLGCVFFFTSKRRENNLDPELFCACRGEGSRALGNPGARFVSDWFQQKTIKVFLIGLFKVCTRAVKRAACLACERVFSLDMLK